MKRQLSLAALCTMVVVLMGCISGERKPEELGKGERVEPPFNPDPETWVKGELFEVWRFRNGEVAGYLGSRHGVQKGNTLILARDGDQINTIEVLHVGRETFFGRVLDRGEDAVEAKVGDIAIKGPQPTMAKTAPEPEDEKSKKKK